MLAVVIRVVLYKLESQDKNTVWMSLNEESCYITHNNIVDTLSCVDNKNMI